MQSNKYDNKKTVLWQGEPRDAAVNFDTYRIYNGIVRFPGFLARLCLQTADNAGLLSKVFVEVVTEVVKKCRRRQPPLSFN